MNLITSTFYTTMYGCGQQQMNACSSSNNGVQICVEPLYEWKIQEIGYDGIEKYIKPQEFKDVVRKNAKRINWRKIVGNDASLDVQVYTSESDEEQQQGEKKHQRRQRKLTPVVVDEQRAATTNAYEPVAGPWAVVGKNLHTGLQELNILLDGLWISTSASYYLNPVVNALFQDDRTELEQINHSKSFQVCTRKKAFMEAARTIERMLKHREQLAIADNRDDGNFTKELRKLRENWRIRKVGHNIYGDLGYKTYAAKFVPHECFDIMQKRTVDKHDSSISYIGIRLAHNFRFHLKLHVFVHSDNETSAQMLFNSKINYKQKNNLLSSDDDIKQMNWKKTLAIAQETLISKDIMTQLINESMTRPDLISMSTENCIVISLIENLLLRVQLHSYSFQDTAPAPELSVEDENSPIPYLSQCLRELFLAEHTNKPNRNQQFVTLPQTPLPENLDMRGPQAFSVEEIQARLKPSYPLIKRFFNCSLHYVLVNRVVEFIDSYMIRFGDPQLQWRWLRATPSFTVISLSFTNRGFENLGKFPSQIRITDTGVTLVMKEAQQIACRRDMALLADALLLWTANFWVNTLNQLSRAYSWQILHANLNAFDATGNPAPTFYTCNQCSTKYMLIQFHTDGQLPDIYIKNTTDEEGNYFHSGTTRNKFDGYHKLKYEHIPGSTFIRKTENLLATFIY